MKTLRNTLFLGSALALVACGGDMGQVDSLEATELGESQAPLMMAAPGQGVPDAYIVKLKDGADPRSVAAVAGVSPRYVYSIINGFAATLNPGQLTALRNNPHVEYIEQDGVVQASATQTNAPWNLDIIDPPCLQLDGQYTTNANASSVNAYIIDTGISTAHPQFGGRAVNVYDAFGGTGADCNGHGTHVAGTVGSITYGVAKGVQLKGVRVLDCNGSGSWSGVIAGMDYVRLNKGTLPAVANLSIGGAYNTSVNTAATNLSNSGVFVAVAAGSSGGDACNYSPASAANVTTVGCFAINITRCSSSNYGPCVEIYAPGQSITSTWNNGGTNILSGTSMASPHVAGVGALYKATYGNASWATINSWLINNAASASFGRALCKGTL
jgi:subtilisin family serine protease